MYHSIKISELQAYMEQKIGSYFGSRSMKLNITLAKDCLIVQLEEFLDGEMTDLINRGEDLDVYRSIRELMTDYTLRGLKKDLEEQFDIRIEELYYDWDEKDRSSLIVGILDTYGFQSHAYEFSHKQKIHEEISRVTYNAEKYPDYIYSFWIDEHNLIMIRQGLLVRIEKELVKEGFEDVLRKTKRRLEKNGFLQSDIAGLTGRRLKAAYLDWEFERDRSVLVYTFEK